MKTSYRLILASQSPRRKEILGRFGVPFEIRVSNADEPANDDDLTPAEYVALLAKSKARAVYEHTGASETGRKTVWIGADTVVVYEDEILGKPKDEEDAFSMLYKLSGSGVTGDNAETKHSVYTGVAVLTSDEAGNLMTCDSFSVCTDVYFGPMSDREIREYIATGEPMDKAGSYGLQGIGGTYIRRIDGDYNNVVGLPLYELYCFLKKEGILE
ncbi:MAG: septum formation protein Maf [Lachnospiraceae bacterium]|nr:septum formation protein Maf [Lachnospiraceae bacterium]